jgi:4-amino-4-deoxy-L-arabinose transferase-like glycosyltransferase
MLIAVSRYAANIAGPVAGAVAPAILATMYGFSRLSEDGRVDMLYAFFVTAATLVGLKGVNEKISRKERLLIALFSGLAILAKGPTGVVLPILIIFFSRVALKGFSAYKEILSWELLLAPLIALPWYLMAFSQGGDGFINRQLIFENLARFTGGDGVNEKDSLFYLPHLIGQGAPWSILFLLYLFFLAKSSFIRVSGLKFKLNRANRFLPVDKKIAQGIINCLRWLGILLTLLTLSAGKRRAYLLLTLPAISLILSLRLSTALEMLERRGGIRMLVQKYRYQLLSWGILVLLIAILPGITLLGYAISDPEILADLFPKAGKLLLGFRAVSIRGGWTLAALLGALVSISFLSWLWGVLICSSRALGIGLYCFLTLCITFYTQCWLAYKGTTHSYKRVGFRLATVIPQTTALTVIKTPRDESFDVLLFYFGRDVRMHDPAQPVKEPGLYLTRKAWLNDNASSNMRRVLEDYRPAERPGEEIQLVQVR